MSRKARHAMHHAEQEKLLFGGGVSSQGLDKALDPIQPGVGGREREEGLPSLIGRLR